MSCRFTKYERDFALLIANKMVILEVGVGLTIACRYRSTWIVATLMFIGSIGAVFYSVTLEDTIDALEAICTLERIGSTVDYTTQNIDTKAVSKIKIHNGPQKSLKVMIIETFDAT